MLIHVAGHFGSIESVPVLIRNDNRISIVLLHGHLNRDPLVIWHEKHFRSRLIEVLTCKEEESGCVSTGQIQHEDAFQLDQIAVFGGFRSILCTTCGLVELEGH